MPGMFPKGEPHECSCRKCRPELFPAETRSPAPVSEKHLAVRFGLGHHMAVVRLWGGKVLDVVELMDGEWAVRYRLPSHRCCHDDGDNSGYCQTVHRGPFEVEWPRGYTRVRWDILGGER